MRESRIFVDQPLSVGCCISLPEQPSRHLLRVLRLPVGAPVVLFNGDGHDWAGQLQDSAPRCAQVMVQERRDVQLESPLEIELWQGVARGERMDYVMQKAVELGVTSIRPIFAERSVVRLRGQRLAAREAHWRGVIAGASEQCGRNRLAVLHPASDLSGALASLPDEAKTEARVGRLLLHPGGSMRLADLPQEPRRWVLAVGPEGGFSDAEVARVFDRNFSGLALGPRILRSETAGMVALAALQTLRGDLG